jgi:mono/diheme cytochrome c family protein
MGKTPLIVIVFAVLAAAGGLLLWLAQPDSANKADAGDPAQVAQGEALYRAQCASCHGAKLEGQPNWRKQLPDGTLPAPPHDASGHTWHHADPLLFKITKDGGQAGAPPGFRSNMPAFGDKLSDAEIWAVLAFIKSRWPPEVQQRHKAINDRYEKR